MIDVVNVYVSLGQTARFETQLWGSAAVEKSRGVVVTRLFEGFGKTPSTGSQLCCIIEYFRSYLPTRLGLF